MRRLSTGPLCVAIALTFGCGDDGSTPEPKDACAVALAIERELLGSLLDSAPRCVADSECVALSTHITTERTEVDLCDVFVTREAALRWDPTDVAAQIEARLPASEYGCSVLATCARRRPVCRAGSCAGESE